MQLSEVALILTDLRAQRTCAPQCYDFYGVQFLLKVTVGQSLQCNFFSHGSHPRTLFLYCAMHKNFSQGWKCCRSKFFPRSLTYLYCKYFTLQPHHYLYGQFPNLIALLQTRCMFKTSSVFCTATTQHYEKEWSANNSTRMQKDQTGPPLWPFCGPVWLYCVLVELFALSSFS